MIETKRMLLLQGASASGKTTLGQFIQTLGVKELISHTTRQPRKGEIDGVTYYYITKEEFDKIDKLEQTYYAGNYYCLSRQEVDRHNEDLVYCIVDVDGVRQIREAYDEENVAVIYLDVSDKQMRERMKLRGDSEEDIEKRIDHCHRTKEKSIGLELCDYAIPNVDLESAKEIIEQIIIKLKRGEE